MSFHVVGLGEVLWDLLPEGPQLGGAPANFAHHAHALGARATVVTRVGDDALGRQIVVRLQDAGLDVAAIQIDEQAPTGTVAVRLGPGGVPQFTIHEDVAWDRLLATPEALKAVRHADAVCFGSLAQRQATSRAAIQSLLFAARTDALRVCDINLRQSYYSREIVEESLRMANVLKLNDDELVVLAALLDLSGSTRDQLVWLANTYALSTVALTRGGAGSLLWHHGEWSDHPGQPVAVVDTVGAGDAFTAALVLGILHGWPQAKVHQHAEGLARYVCSSAGATPDLPLTLRTPFLPSDPSQ